MVLQVGRGSFIPEANSCPGLRLQAFRYKESIAENIQSADIVISHAGEKPILARSSPCLFIHAPVRTFTYILRNTLVHIMAMCVQTFGHT